MGREGDEGTVVPTLDTAALDDLLVETKLAVPHSPEWAISRARLIEAARARGCRAVGITAPAGYGKSTLLAQWAHAEARRVGWVSLDRFDDDPAVLVGLLAAAFERLTGEAGLAHAVRGNGDAALARAAPRLAAAFRTARVPFVLIVDDLHELQLPACHDVLSLVVDAVPAGSQLVTASRSEQPHLPRLRAAGDAHELSTGDLALDAAGAVQIFETARVAIAPETAQTLLERTEGWPVGLYLAAVIAGADGGDPLRISGTDRFVADYLYRESLATMSPDEQRFLRRTAVLERFCAPLCEAVVSEPGAAATLRRLESASSFLVPLDRRREWYRYHGLFREFLLADLAVHEPEVVNALHVRAADWLSANGSPTLAVEHVLATDDRERAIRLVTSLLQPAYQAGQISTVHRWLAELGDDAAAEYPPLALLAAWLMALTGQSALAARWAVIVEDAVFDLPPADGTASFASARAMWRAFTRPAGPQQALADATFALTSEPTPSPWRSLALAVCAEAHLLNGDITRATSMFAEAASVAEATGNADNVVVAAAELALLAMDRGGWDDAATHVELALTTIDRHRTEDYATSGLAFAGAARLALHRGELAAAHVHLAQAMRTRPRCTVALPILAVRVRLHLAKSYWAIADHATARQLLFEIDDVLRAWPALGHLSDEVTTFREVASSLPVPVLGGVQPLSPAELRVLPYLQTHLTIGEIAQRLFVSRNTIRTQVSAIYRKFGVSSRSEAVQRATASGLLGG